MSCEQMPNYPDPSKFVRLFKYESSDSPRSTGHWVLGSTPGSVAGAAEQEGTGWEWAPGYPRPAEFHRWALTFPTYEILNTHGSSSFGTGIVVAVIVGSAVGATKGKSPQYRCRLGCILLKMTAILLLTGGSAASETSLCALTHPCMTLAHPVSCPASLTPRTNY